MTTKEKAIDNAARVLRKAEKAPADNPAYIDQLTNVANTWLRLAEHLHYSAQ